MKEVERLKREMEEDDEEFGLAEEEAEVNKDVDEPSGSDSPEEVTYLPSPVDREHEPTLPEPDNDATFDAGVRGQNAADDVEESPVPFGKKGKRNGKSPLGKQTKTEKSLLMSIPGTDTVLQQPAECIQPKVELSKREKRRLKEAKKAQETKSSIQAHVCEEYSLANRIALIL